MSVTVVLKVEDANERLEDFNQIRLERAPSVAGAYVLVNTFTLVEDTFYYTFEDTNGAFTSYYKYRFYNSVSLEATPYTNPFRPSGGDRKYLRQKLIKDYRLGVTFEAIAAGGSTSVIPTNDPRVRSVGFRDNRGKNAWLRRVFLSANEDRLIVSTAPNLGTITVNPSYSIAPSDGNIYEWHWFVPPEECDEAINRALTMRYVYLDQVPITGIAGANEYALTNLPWLTQKRQVTGLWWHPEEGVSRRPWSGPGRWWNLYQDQGRMTLQLPYLQEGVVAYLEALRYAAPLFTDESVFPNTLSDDLIVCFAYDELLTWLLEGGHNGTNVDRSAWDRIQKKLRAEKMRELISMHAPQPEYALPATQVPNTYPRPYTAR